MFTKENFEWVSINHILPNTREQTAQQNNLSYSSTIQSFTVSLLQHSLNHLSVKMSILPSHSQATSYSYIPLLELLIQVNPP